jgi:hypothetical protein
MTIAESKKLHTILAKVETLQNQVSDFYAKERLGAAKAELLRLLSKIEHEA